LTLANMLHVGISSLTPGHVALSDWAYLHTLIATEPVRKDHTSRLPRT
jgi:hypothetical protein